MFVGEELCKASAPGTDGNAEKEEEEDEVEFRALPFAAFQSNDDLPENAAIRFAVLRAYQPLVPHYLAFQGGLHSVNNASTRRGEGTVSW